MNEKIELLQQLKLDKSKDKDSTRQYKIWIVLLAAVVAILLWLFWLNFNDNQHTLQQCSAPLTSSDQSAIPSLTPIVNDEKVLEASGYVIPRRRATISSNITARVKSVLVEEGMQVTEGQVIAILDNEPMANRVALAKANLAVSKARLARAKIEKNFAIKEYDKIQKIFASGMGNQREMDQAEMNVETLTSAITEFERALRVDEVTIRINQQQLEDTEIVAPFSGTVISKSAQPGEIISPVSAGGGFTRTGICTIVDMESLEVEVDVNEAYIDRIYPGQPVQVTLEAFPQLNLDASVIVIVPTADRQKATVKVRIGFAKNDPRILPDMSVNVSFLAEK